MLKISLFLEMGNNVTTKQTNKNKTNTPTKCNTQVVDLTSSLVYELWIKDVVIRIGCVFSIAVCPFPTKMHKSILSEYKSIEGSIQNYKFTCRIV